ncbi:transmembrane protein, putative [Medicago truncatula]|uniref:Transmembrane protein, putative n=1 Tax=Medicago truncatula TaxID=3880 RepID=A0A072UA65_MEDTR|nr:transmembrane protein, putative [Medicago truncatula]
MVCYSFIHVHESPSSSIIACWSWLLTTALIYVHAFKIDPKTLEEQQSCIREQRTEQGLVTPRPRYKMCR